MPAGCRRQRKIYLNPFVSSVMCFTETNITTFFYSDHYPPWERGKPKGAKKRSIEL
jgi:hypothetical protein